MYRISIVFLFLRETLSGKTFTQAIYLLRGNFQKRQRTRKPKACHSVFFSFCLFARTFSCFNSYASSSFLKGNLNMKLIGKERPGWPLKFYSILLKLHFAFIIKKQFTGFLVSQQMAVKNCRLAQKFYLHK